MTKLIFIVTGIALLCLSACQKQVSACPNPTGTREYLKVAPEELPAPIFETNSAPITIKIGGKPILVNRIVEGPLCNDSWSGMVYITCNVQVYQWEEQPTFLKDCNLSIAPGSVVYVAYHNDTAYYNGCSCHTGEIAGP